MPTIEYFYAAYSGYAYIGSRLFMDMAQAAGRRIDHRPFDLRVLLQSVGAHNGRSPRHRAYFSGREIERWAEHRGVDILARPTHHDNDITLPNCVLIAGVRQGLDMDALAHRMLESHWRDDSDLADAATLAGLAREVGLDGEALLTAARTPEVLAAYEANTAEAMERSVFGSPTYFVDGDMFYGQDHLDLVARACEAPFKGEWPRR